MADLNDRGQIILIAGFALAVIFIALALVVNSAIFTENLATRGETTGGSDALIERHQVEGSVATIIGSVNDETSATPLNETNRSVANMSLQGGIQNAESGRIVTTEVVGDSEYLDARLFQTNVSRNYTNAPATDNGNWTLASNATRVQGAEFNVSADSLTNVTRENSSEAFNFVINDSNDVWEMAVYEPRDESDDVAVTVEENDTDLGTCFSGDTYTTINVTNGSVAGNPCLALDAANRTYTDYSVNTTSFDFPEKIRGNYSIELELNDSDDLDPDNYNATESPVADVDIEYLDVRYIYNSVNAQYETVFTVEPEGS